MREPEPLVCGDCGRRYRWRADYQSKPCPDCGGRLRPQSTSYVRADRAEPDESPFADMGGEAPPFVKKPRAATRDHWIGDGQVAGRPLGRVFDAGCWIVGGASIAIGGIVGTNGNGPSLWGLLMGLAAAAYGARILATDGWYLMNLLVYFVAAISVIYGVSLVVG